MSGVDFNGRQIRKGAGDSVTEWVRGQGGTIDPVVSDLLEQDLGRGRDPPARRRRHAGPRRRRPPGHRQGGDEGPVRPPARDGHPHHHDHRRQPADGRRHRPGGRGRRLPRPGHARAEARADPQGAGGRQPRRDDGRRHQRRAGAGAGRRRRGDEHRHAGGPRGRQHGRPRLEPDQADRGRRDRQAAPDDAGLADDLLDRQRRRQVLRDPAGHVRRDLPGPERA